MGLAKTVPLPAKDCFHPRCYPVKAKHGNYTAIRGISYTIAETLCHAGAFRRGLVGLVCFLMGVLPESFF